MQFKSPKKNSVSKSNCESERERERSFSVWLTRYWKCYVRAIKLNVSAAFHSRLMRDAAAVVERELNNVSLHTPVVPFISNVTANEESDPTRLRSLLVQQITQTIRWVDCVQTAITKKQIKFFLEVGPKRVLTGLIQQINSTVSAWSLGSVDDIRLFFEYIRKRNKTES
jgi:[acyl-carrier-protein] S-malonyltransferase